ALLPQPGLPRRARLARLLRGQRRGRVPDAIQARGRYQRRHRGSRQPYRPVRRELSEGDIVLGRLGGLVCNHTPVRPADPTHFRTNQCRKCRTPVKTIASPCSSQAATESASRIEPPGCTMAVTPALAAASTLSRNGKNASEASTEPRERSADL